MKIIAFICQVLDFILLEEYIIIEIFVPKLINFLKKLYKNKIICSIYIFNQNMASFRYSILRTEILPSALFAYEVCFTQ
ncbi:unnamed protein product [Blepharisma stoltei]|uniref:Uncharacterized protein n=1 Tax=Blepharisma stoltei TaxID=1481888 RepID=A0AAU9JCC7_9CILI|nr:unnamed protein product [Blepharisma stoltei]